MYHLSASYLCMNMYNYLYHCIPYISGQSRQAVQPTPSLRPRPFSLGSRIGTAPQDVEPRPSSAPSSAAGSRCPHAWHASHEKPESDSRKILGRTGANYCSYSSILFGALCLNDFPVKNVETTGIPMDPNGCSPCHVAQSEVKGPVEVPR